MSLSSWLASLFRPKGGVQGPVGGPHPAPLDTTEGRDDPHEPAHGAPDKSDE